MQQKSDIVIIGGGLIGLFIAYYLAKKSKNTILAIEASSLAGHASGANLGGAWPSGEGVEKKIFRTLAFASLKLYEELHESEGFNFEYRRNGTLRIIRPGKINKDPKEYVEDRRMQGFKAVLLDGPEIHEMEPFLAEDIEMGIFYPEDIQLNPLLLLQELANQLKKMGVKVQTLTEVTSIERKGKRIISVETKNGKIFTPIVVNAAGPWAPHIGKLLDIHIPIFPAKGQMLLTEPLPRLINSGIYEDVGIVQTLSGNIMAGGTVEFVGYDTKASIHNMKFLSSQMTKAIPILKKVNVIRSWAKLRPCTEDHLPILEKCEPLEGFYITAGHFKNGLLLAPITGKLMSELIIDGIPSIPLDPLSLSRFVTAEEKPEDPPKKDIQ